MFMICQDRYNLVTKTCNGISLQSEISDTPCQILMLIKNFVDIHVKKVSEERKRNVQEGVVRE